MLSYELCLKLKGAGFPQESDYTFFMDEAELECAHHEFGGLEIYNGGVKCPQLSEIIKACGDDFYDLAFCKNGEWCVHKRFIIIQSLVKQQKKQSQISNLNLNLNLNFTRNNYEKKKIKNPKSSNSIYKLTKLLYYKLNYEKD